jgi:hypothetical protein
MLPFLQLHALAATRGDGLRPELRVLLERLAEAPQAASNIAVTIADDQPLMDVIGFSSEMAPDRNTLRSATLSADRPTASMAKPETARSNWSYGTANDTDCEASMPSCGRMPPGIE